MNKTVTTTILLALISLFAEPGAARTLPPAPQNINWAQAPVMRLSLGVGFFRPGKLIFHVGQPVRLIFRNDGVTTHDFVTNLFGAVSQRAGIRKGGVRVILQVTDTVEYDIVPEVPGIYSIQTVMFMNPGAVPSVEAVIAN